MNCFFKHPGGVDAIQEYAGKNATKAFSNIGHSLDAKNLLKQFMIGELAEVRILSELSLNTMFKYYAMVFSYRCTVSAL